MERPMVFTIITPAEVPYLKASYPDGTLFRVVDSIGRVWGQYRLSIFPSPSSVSGERREAVKVDDFGLQAEG